MNLGEKIFIRPEHDSGGEAFCVEDDTGRFLADASSPEEAFRIAREIAKHHPSVLEIVYLTCQ